MSIDSPWGIGGPAGIDPARQKVIEDAFTKSLQTPAVREALMRAGQGTRLKGHEEFSRFALKAADEERALLTKYGFAPK